MNKFSEYVVYVDESGDHGLKNINQDYPIFVLAFCIFQKSTYAEQLVPTIQKFKFKHFGHDQIILHETDIRKDRGDFSQLKDRASKQAFLNELTDIVEATPFTLISTVIRKELYARSNKNETNPYHIALAYGLERVYYYLRTKRQVETNTHIVVEKRGKREDDELELEFRRICAGSNYRGKKLPFELIFSDKKSNSTGLQLADLVARPIGLSILKPEQPNRAFDILKNKFYSNDNGNYMGRGLKCYP